MNSFNPPRPKLIQALPELVLGGGGRRSAMKIKLRTPREFIKNATNHYHQPVIKRVNQSNERKQLILK